MTLICGNPVTYLHVLRGAKNRVVEATPNRIQRRREKFDFADFVTKAGARAPRTFALIANGLVREAVFASGEAVASFLTKIPQGHYFCKPNKGRNGIGAFRLTVAPEGLFIDDEPCNLAAAAERLSSEDYVVQEWMAPFQHPDIARFRDGVINTVRLITFDTDRGPRAVAASLRMAISLKSIDSWTQGGVVAAIDLDKGVLKPFGILKKGQKIVEAHPGSGLAFRDQPIPHFDRAVSIACRLHAMLDTPKSLGWDIGLLEDGPCFLEANGPWDILMSAQFNAELVPELIAFLLPQPCEFAVRADFKGSFIDRTAICRTLGKVLGASMTSGRIEHLSRERLLLTVGGTRRTARTAVALFKPNVPKFGASSIAISRSRDIPERGFDATAAYPDR